MALPFWEAANEKESACSLLLIGRCCFRVHRMGAIWPQQNSAFGRICHGPRTALPSTDEEAQSDFLTEMLEEARTSMPESLISAYTRNKDALSQEMPTAKPQAPFMELQTAGLMYITVPC